MLLNGLADDSMHRAARICGVQSRRGADWLISVPHKTSRRNRSDSLYISPPKTTISYSLFVLSDLLILLSLLSQVNTFLKIFKCTTSRHIRLGRHRIIYHNILYEYDASLGPPAKPATVVFLLSMHWQGVLCEAGQDELKRISDLPVSYAMAGVGAVVIAAGMIFHFVWKPRQKKQRDIEEAELQTRQAAAGAANPTNVTSKYG